MSHNIKSVNQKGGVTAGEVNIGQQTNVTGEQSPEKRGIWWKTLCSILGAIAAIATISVAFKQCSGE